MDFWVSIGSTYSYLTVMRIGEAAARAGVQWLLQLQNRDGGWPTFCRGWGKLPFDRSGTDLTAHALRALYQWRSLAPDRIQRATKRGLKFLEQQQATGHGQVLQEQNRLHLVAKIGMKDQRAEHTEARQQKSADARLLAE